MKKDIIDNDMNITENIKAIIKKKEFKDLIDDFSNGKFIYYDDNSPIKKDIYDSFDCLSNFIKDNSITIDDDEFDYLENIIADSII